MDKIIARLSYLSNMLSKYSHRWGECPSMRMINWVDEYEDIRRNSPTAFKKHCELRGFDPHHDAYDCLA